MGINYVLRIQEAKLIKLLFERFLSHSLRLIMLLILTNTIPLGGLFYFFPLINSRWVGFVFQVVLVVVFASCWLRLSYHYLVVC